MATKEELYVSFKPEIYKMNKSNILMCQADLLGTLKRIHNLKILSRRKQDLKIKLHKLFTSALSGVDSIQNKMPTSKVPKKVQKSNESTSKSKELFSGHDSIDAELKSIQEKLKELNS